MDSLVCNGSLFCFISVMLVIVVIGLVIDVSVKIVLSGIGVFLLGLSRL